MGGGGGEGGDKPEAKHKTHRYQLQPMINNRRKLFGEKTRRTARGITSICSEESPCELHQNEKQNIWHLSNHPYSHISYNVYEKKINNFT